VDGLVFSHFSVVSPFLQSRRTSAEVGLQLIQILTDALILVDILDHYADSLAGLSEKVKRLHT
jgi:hypothetical protein